MRHRTTKKSRTCYDRFRKRNLAARRARRNDPAASASIQLLAIFNMIFGRAPLLPQTPVPYSAPSYSPLSLQRGELARRLGVPHRYLGLIASQGQVPYSLLFEHIGKGGVLRRDALVELRKRAPAASLEWFDHVERWGFWSDLLRCQSPSGFDQDTDVKLLKSTLAWLDQSNGDNGGFGGPPGPA